MYFCYQSENAFISYVIVFFTSKSRYTSGFSLLFCQLRRSVCTALSALSLTQESVFNFLPSNCLLFKYLLCIEHFETTNIARWITGGTQPRNARNPCALPCYLTKIILFCWRKGLLKGPNWNFSCDYETLFAGQHEEPEVDFSEFRVVSVTPSWNKIYIFCSLGYLPVNQKRAFLGAFLGWGNRLLA